MATGVLAPMKFARLQGLQSIPIQHGVEGSGQSYKVGELLIYSSGTLVIATTDPASIVVGLALKNATGTAGADAPFIVLQEGVIIEATLLEGSAAAHIVAQTDIGTAYGVAVSSNKWYIDQSETSATLFRPIGLVAPFVIGDTSVRVFAQPVTAKYLP